MSAVQNYPCDWKAGFVMDASKKQRVGYLTAFTGLGTQVGALAQDIEVWSPYGATPTYAGVAIAAEKVKCVGIIQSVDYGGGVGDPYGFNVYISGNNAQKLNAAMKNTFDSTTISVCNWWVGNFDEEEKAWYEEVYPKNNDMKGMLNAQGKNMKIAVDSVGVKVNSNVDVKVFSWYFEIVPAANVLTDVLYAVGVKKNSVKHWGLSIAGNT